MRGKFLLVVSAVFCQGRGVPHFHKQNTNDVQEKQKVDLGKTKDQRVKVNYQTTWKYGSDMTFHRASASTIKLCCTYNDS